MLRKFSLLLLMLLSACTDLAPEAFDDRGRGVWVPMDAVPEMDYEDIWGTGEFAIYAAVGAVLPGAARAAGTWKTVFPKRITFTYGAARLTGSGPAAKTSSSPNRVAAGSSKNSGIASFKFATSSCNVSSAVRKTNT